MFGSDFAAAAERLPRMRCRLADGELDLSSNWPPVLPKLDEAYGDGTTATRQESGKARFACTVLVRPGTSLALVEVRAPERLDTAATALDLVSYLTMGDAAKFREVASPAPGWRAIAAEVDPGNPVILAGIGRMLVDLEREPVFFLHLWLVASTLRLQTGIAVVHAGSASIGDAGVLLAGPSGSGKTTLALALAVRGHEFFGDNVAALRPTTGELLPYGRIGMVREGPRAALVDALIKAHRAVPVSDERRGIEPRIRFRVTEFLPDRPRAERAVTLRFAFFLRGRAPQPIFEEFRPTRDDFETVLKPLTYDAVVATSWGSTPGSWLIKHLQILRLLQSVRCFHVDAGAPDATADAIEQIIRGEPWDSR